MAHELQGVTVSTETLLIPTYAIGQPDKNPMFLEKRVYQGSSGVVYPYPVIERVFDEKTDQPYQAVFLENRYLKIMILPELGGRVQMALDKTNNYHFIYYNQVIKPALVGLTGPWISGGIEFNWPQHHRPSTFLPVDYHIEENSDGSKTVWCSEIERMFRTKGMVGFTLYPDKAYLELKVQLYNRTNLPQSFLWWANPAVAVNNDYQSVFPPDVHAVMDHGKRDVSTFPIATGTYYKMNYAPGTDISRYKNIPVPTSYMAYHSDFDFLGCYDHGRQAGMMHVADHHLVPGKKQWTWGNGDFGRTWDRQLTDQDGPYIELMCGAFTDNQPDFSWLQPGEEKRFTQIFMPYKSIGAAQNANKDAVINLEIDNQASTATIGVYVTSPRHVYIKLFAGTHSLYEIAAELDPVQALIETVELPPGTIPRELTLLVIDNKTGHELIRFTPLADDHSDVPAPASAANPPGEIATNEELFLNGLHLEQYRHASYAPEPYYEEALLRDPLDSRCNNALGLLLLRRGKFAEAERYFRTAITGLTRRNPNPYDGEPYYNLGLSLQMQGRYQDAFDAFYKATWNAAWQDAAFFELARLTSRKGDYAQALVLVDRSLARNQYHHKAHHLKTVLLRHLGHLDQARDQAKIGLHYDCMNSGLLYEQHLLAGAPTYHRLLMGTNPNTYLEISLDYAHAGFLQEAIALLAGAPQTDPLVKYFQGWYLSERGGTAEAHLAFEQAATLPPDYCFPNQIECVTVLQTAIAHNARDSRAMYYLGNFWYGHRRYEEAIACWEQSRQIDPKFPTVQRNLGLAYMNKRHNAQQAKIAYDHAFALDPKDARVFFELDQLYKARNQAPSQRLTRLSQYLPLVQQRDDLMIEYIALLNQAGRFDEALQLLTVHTFHPWEGGEGKVIAQYVLSLVEIAKQHLQQSQWQKAIDHLLRAQTYPDNLGEGKLYGVRENNIHFFLGIAYTGLHDSEKARDQFVLASEGSSEPSSPLYYNDQPPDMLFYQGLAQQWLGNSEKSQIIFANMIAYGETHLTDHVTIDYFAVSLPDFLVFERDLQQRNVIHCHYMIALGLLGRGRDSEAQSHIALIVQHEPHHLGAVIHQALLNDLFWRKDVIK
jgi:tetratricopeptide (TPR) repeat protein